MPRLLVTLWCALAAAPAWAQADDAPIPYPDDEERHELPRRSEAVRPRQEVQVEKEDREKHLGRFDDPNRGIAAEVIGGLLLFQASAGGGTTAAFGGGVRATWEWGRLFPDEFFHEAWFADLSWTYAFQHSGTSGISTDSNFHYFSLAPAFTFPFGAQSPFGAYLQLGGGVAYQVDAIGASGAQTTVSGLKPLIQYGLGLRGRPALNAEGTVRLALRLELTRFRRGYLDDTYLGGSVGLDF